MGSLIGPDNNPVKFLLLLPSQSKDTETHSQGISLKQRIQKANVEAHPHTHSLA